MTKDTDAVLRQMIKYSLRQKSPHFPEPHLIGNRGRGTQWWR